MDSKEESNTCNGKIDVDDNTNKNKSADVEISGDNNKNQFQDLFDNLGVSTTTQNHNENPKNQYQDLFKNLADSTATQNHNEKPTIPEVIDKTPQLEKYRENSPVLKQQAVHSTKECLDEEWDDEFNS